MNRNDLVEELSRRPRALNGRPADGISADPGRRAYTVWYISIGQSC